MVRPRPAAQPVDLVVVPVRVLVQFLPVFPAGVPIHPPPPPPPRPPALSIVPLPLKKGGEKRGRGKGRSVMERGEGISAVI